MNLNFDLHFLIEQIINYLLIFINKIGYLGIFLGMFVESTVFPLPSEIIMIPAGLAAAKGDMNLALVIFFGVAGNVFGAIFSYFVALKLGHPILMKFGKYFFLKPEVLLKMEKYFQSHGEISVFIARLLPVLRHLISIPAGIFKMNFSKFCFYTLLGSTIWTSILAFLGFFIGNNETIIKQYSKLILIGVILFCVLIAAIYKVYNTKSHLQ